jgi:hypothetical protein
MSFKKVQTALETRLAAWGNPGNLDIAWEGTYYKAKQGVAFIRPTNLSAESDLLDIQEHVQSNTGIFQIDVFMPLRGQGTGKLLDTMSSLMSHFKDQKQITSPLADSVTVTIRNVSRLALQESENTWMIGSIQVNYTSYF